MNRGWSFVLSLGILSLWVEAVKLCAKYGLLKPWHRRKLLHIFTGPIFILSWALFGDSRVDSFWAAAVPLAMTAKFFLVGTGYIDDPDTVNSGCRSGDRRELLRGPLLYGLVFIASTILYWKRTRGVISLFALCFGDGFAEIFGRLFGSNNRLPWCSEKSLAGSCGFVMLSYCCTRFFLAIFAERVLLHSENSLNDSSGSCRLLFVSVICACVESLPLTDIDNATIFLAGIAADSLYFVIHGFYS